MTEITLLLLLSALNVKMKEINFKFLKIPRKSAFCLQIWNFLTVDFALSNFYWNRFLAICLFALLSGCKCGGFNCKIKVSLKVFYIRVGWTKIHSKITWFLRRSSPWFGYDTEAYFVHFIPIFSAANFKITPQNKIK